MNGLREETGVEELLRRGEAAGCLKLSEVELIAEALPEEEVEALYEEWRQSTG